MADNTDEFDKLLVQYSQQLAALMIKEMNALTATIEYISTTIEDYHRYVYANIIAYHGKLCSITEEQDNSFATKQYPLIYCQELTLDISMNIIYNKSKQLHDQLRTCPSIDCAKVSNENTSIDNLLQKFIDLFKPIENEKLRNIRKLQSVNFFLVEFKKLKNQLNIPSAHCDFLRKYFAIDIKVSELINNFPIQQNDELLQRS